MNAGDSMKVRQRTAGVRKHAGSIKPDALKKTKEEEDVNLGLQDGI